MTTYYASAPRNQHNILALVDVLLQQRASGDLRLEQPPPEPTTVESDRYRGIRESLERQRDGLARNQLVTSTADPA